MRFRLKAFGLHLLASAIVLTFVLGTLYLGWYRWPGWYLSGASTVVMVLAGVDLALGPLLTFVVARAAKPRRELRRDIAVIVIVQFMALLGGTGSLWWGRPLYYAFSENVLQLVQSNDIDEAELALARQQQAALLPHWYSLPRWIWAPLPQDPVERARIVQSAIGGGADVIAMPRYYYPWSRGLTALGLQLKKVDELPYFSRPQKDALKQALRATGLAADQSNTISFTGRGTPLLTVFDPRNLRLRAYCKVSGARAVRASCERVGD